MEFRKNVEPETTNSGASKKNKCCSDCKDSEKLSHSHEHHHLGLCSDKEEHIHKCSHRNYLEVK